MTNPKGLHFAAHRGRVVASLQRLPCQKTKPKGLLGKFCRLSFEFIIVLDSITRIRVLVFRVNLYRFRIVSSTNNPIGVSPLVGQC